jgi:transketolase
MDRTSPVEPLGGIAHDAATVERLGAIARALREDVIDMLATAGSGHPGGSLSAIDILATLFHREMRHRPEEPHWPGRDRFVLSKGHAVPALYAALAHAGYFPRAELPSLRTLGSRLQGHPANQLLPGVEASTGSLGQGLSIALGMALAAKLDHGESAQAPRVYCMIGDGEMQEGQIWEAALCAPKYKLDNLCVFLDYNRAQIDGLVKDVMSIDPVEAKWRAFNWHVVTINGHDYGRIMDALDEARRTRGRPTFVVAHTIKGKGVSLFEQDLVKWHGVAPSKEEAAAAVAEVRQGLKPGSW